MPRYLLAIILLLTPCVSQAQFVLGNIAPIPRADNPFFAKNLFSLYVDNLNLIGPTHVPILVNTRNCGTDDAYYIPSQNSVVFCNELVINILQDFVAYRKDQIFGAYEANSTLMFIALHEAAHVYIDHYQLPISGREEDVADQIAMFFMLEVFLHDERNRNIHFVSGPIKFFSYRLSQPTIGTFADEHSLSQQRIANMICWSYGYDPATFGPLIQAAHIPEQRAQKCGREWKHIRNFMFSIFIPAATAHRQKQ